MLTEKTVKMEFNAACKKYEPNRMIAGFKRDGDYAKKHEVIRYFFRDEREVFYQVKHDPEVVVIDGARDWASKFINAFNWNPFSQEVWYK